MSEIITAATVMISVLWVVAPCRLVRMYHSTSCRTLESFITFTSHSAFVVVLTASVFCKPQMLRYQAELSIMIWRMFHSSCLKAFLVRLTLQWAHSGVTIRQLVFPITCPTLPQCITFTADIIETVAIVGLTQRPLNKKDSLVSFSCFSLCCPRFWYLKTST
jgi:hypothetical protein